MRRLQSVLYCKIRRYSIYSDVQYKWKKSSKLNPRLYIFFHSCTIYWINTRQKNKKTLSMPLECRRGHFVYDSISSGELNQQDCKELIQPTADLRAICPPVIWDPKESVENPTWCNMSGSHLKNVAWLLHFRNRLSTGRKLCNREQLVCHGLEWWKHMPFRGTMWHVWKQEELERIFEISILEW